MKRAVLDAAVVLVLAGACHDGSGSGFSGDSTAPIVELTFPPPVSATDAESITVTGTASDPSGVAEIRVNGVLADTTDGFATWSAQVLLAPGMNTLAVEASDSVGNSDVLAAQASIDSQALVRGPGGIAVDPARQVAFVLESGLKAVDLRTGIRTRVSDPAHTFFGAGIALDGNRALIAQVGPPHAVIAVDLASGAVTTLSDDAHGIGPSLSSPTTIAVDVDRALVTTGPAMTKDLVAVDLTSGDRTLLSSPTLGSGPALRSPMSIVVDGGRALVLDQQVGVVAVDLVTGDRTILSDENTGTGPAFEYPQDMTLDFERVLVTDRSLGAVLAVDLLSGDRTIVSDHFEAPHAPTSIALDLTDPSRVIVADPFLGALQAVDLSTGELSLVTPRTSVGTGPSFRDLAPEALALQEDRLLVGGRGLERSLLAVDLATGDRTVVSDPATGNGPQFLFAEAIVVDGDRALVLSGRTIFAVDLASGDRSIVSNASTGVGPMFDDPDEIALAGNYLLVADDYSLLAVELASGDRTILSGGGDVQAIVVDGDRAFVVDQFHEDMSAILAVDLASGERSIIADDSVGAGPILLHASDLVLDGDRVLVLARGGLYGVDLATGDRTVLSGATTGTGPLVDLLRIASSGERVWATDPNLHAVLALDLRFGQRTIVTR